MIAPLLAAAAVALGPAPAPVLAALPARPRFSYDKHRPLALRLGRENTFDGGARQSLSFDAGHGRASAYWTHPAGDGRWPVVLFSPGSDGDASAQLQSAERLARVGIASLQVAQPARLVTCRAAADVRTFVNYVVGRRRALDLLPRLRGADPGRVAAVGFSFGAAVSATLAGVDRRVGTVALQSGRAHLSAPIGAFCHSTKYARAYGVIDPFRFVGASKATFLLQNGRRDPISPERDIAALVAAIHAPKEQRWYDADHELDDEARGDLDGWLAKRLQPHG